MTEMVYGAVPVRDGEPIVPKWWRTIDKWAMSCILMLFAVGLLLGLAASPPLAAKNGFEPFHYVQRQAAFGGIALMAMIITSMMSPVLVRRLAVLGFIAAFVALAIMQPDFGQACLILFSWGVMYFVAGAPMLLLVGMALLAVFGGTVAYSNSEHFARRIDGFLNPDVDPRTQLGYATNAIQEGGFFGVGVGEGQVKWSLPDAHTDFIIAVAAEEYGLILVLVIIALYATVVVRSLLRLVRERDPFIRLAGTGLACTLGVQAMINMGVAVRLLPAKGMTLPFVSYGGSSVIASGIAVGMLLAFTRTRPQGEISDILSRGRST